MPLRSSTALLSFFFALFLNVAYTLIPPSVIQTGSQAAVYQATPLLKATTNQLASHAASKGRQIFWSAQELLRNGLKASETRIEYRQVL